jgi:hypothetical protein
LSIYGSEHSFAAKRREKEMNDGRGSTSKRARARFLSAIVLTMTFLGTACSYKAGYNVTYMPKSPETVLNEGMVLIYMTQEEEGQIFTGSPTSITGGATTLSLPLGNITKQIAEHIFSQHFSQVRTSNTMTNTAMYVVTIRPTVQEFEYAYNSLQNLGFAITPEVEVSLHVEVFDANG